MAKEKPITNITLRLVGEDGNAWSIMGRASRALRQNGRGDLVNEFTAECMSGNYDHLLQTCERYFVCE